MSSESASALSPSDVHDLVHLLAETAGISGDNKTRKTFLADGIAGFIDAQAWLWALTSGVQPDGSIVPVTLLHGGLSPHHVATVLEAWADPHDPLPEAAALRQRAATEHHFTACRQDLVPDAHFHQARHTARYRKPLNLDQSLYSLFRLQNSMHSLLAFYRHWNRPAFTLRDVKMVHTISSEIGALHHIGEPAFQVIAPVDHLPPRLRPVLGLLMEGMSRKQIAYHLSLSEYTVRDYISEIYQHLGVSSHVDLVRRLSTGEADPSLRSASTI